MYDNKIKPIAFYLPQFHPIPENDEWWGKGFTEWTNVGKAKPLFRGHYQPHVPADLGYYDLRLPEVRQLQAEMARDNGIYGFCYYHYWFNGRRILETPFNEVFSTGKPDFPFMLCWANENWTRRWDGYENDILLEQNYSFEDDLEHIRYLIPIFKDKRYIKVNDKPVFCVYRSTLFPNIEKTINIWREEAFKEGFELYICRIETLGSVGKNFLKGFDAAIDFEPFANLASYNEDWGNNKIKFLKHKIINKLNRILKKETGTILDYSDYAEWIIKNNSKVNNEYKRYPGITPSWDNSARKKNNYLIMHNSSPTLYKKWLSSILDNFTPFSEEENFLFINAWNEWAEGNHLEPDLKWGKEYLLKTKETILKFK